MNKTTIPSIYLLYIPRLICNVAGDSVRLSKDSGIIKVYELVVTNLECGLLHVEHGVVELQAQHNRVNVTCHGNHKFHGMVI